MNYGNIKKVDIANGEGVRVSLFVSGCRHHCKGCFNPETWSFNFGKTYTKETENEIIELLKPNYIQGLTLLGGEPMEKENQRTLIELLRRVKKELPLKDIWCYSGYTFETDIKNKNGKAHTEFTDEILSYINVLIDGEFVESLKNLSLAFRGSSNQRIIDMQQTLKTGKVELLDM